MNPENLVTKVEFQTDVNKENSSSNESYTSSPTTIPDVGSTSVPEGMDPVLEELSVPELMINVSGPVMHPLLLRWRHIARLQKRLHSMTYQDYRRRNTILAFSIIILALISATINLVKEFATEKGTTGMWEHVVPASFAILSSTLAFIYYIFGLSKKEAEHETYVAKFQDIIQEINTEAALNQINDTPISQQTEFIRRMNLEFHSLCENAPPIPSHINKWGEHNDVI